MAITKIAQVTVGAGGASSIDFAAIAGTYTDLQLTLSLRGTTDYPTGRIRFNGDSSSAYSYKVLLSDASSMQTAQSASTTYATLWNMQDSSSTANTFGNGYVYIPNYAGATTKPLQVEFATESGVTRAAYNQMMAQLWNNTAVITSISLSLDAGNFAQYSSATLYGISKSGATGASVS